MFMQFLNAPRAAAGLANEVSLPAITSGITMLTRLRGVDFLSLPFLFCGVIAFLVGLRSSSALLVRGGAAASVVGVVLLLRTALRRTTNKDLIAGWKSPFF